jgi:hypothetical protein
MTARRRRKSGSGPSATALIAWVGGARTGIGAPEVAPGSVLSSLPISRLSGGQMSGSRALLVGRACGLAAGTLLACGSVLVGATHVGESSLAGDNARLLSPVPAGPDATGGTAEEYRADPPAEPTSAAPDLVSAQGVTDPSPMIHPPLGPVRRNTPVSLDVPADAPRRNSDTAQQPWNSSPQAAGHAQQDPIPPVSPVLDPATKGVGRVAPVGGVLAPTEPSTNTAKDNGAKDAGEKQPEITGNKRVSSPREKRASTGKIGAVETVKQVMAPVDNTITPAIQPVVRSVIQPAAQPAMSMLAPLLPIG